MEAVSSSIVVGVVASVRIVVTRFPGAKVERLLGEALLVVDDAALVVGTRMASTMGVGVASKALSAGETYH